MSKRLLTLTDTMDKMITEIMNKKGYPSISSVIHQGVIDLHTKIFPAYVMEKKKKITPEQKFLKDKEDKDERERLIKAEKKDICRELGGKVRDGMCIYFTYINGKRYQQENALLHLSKEIITTQYQPSKEKVMRLREEGKVNYEF